MDEGLVSAPTKSAKPTAKGQAKTPLSALTWRAEFKKRKIRTMSEDIGWWTLLICALVLLLLRTAVFNTGQNTLWNLLGGLGLLGTVIGIAWLVFTVIRQQWGVMKPFQPFCPQCGKYISADVEWRCGFCNGRNTRTRSFSFLYKCEHCGAIPKAYRCQHCEKSIFLDTANDDTHCAMMFIEPTAEAAKPIAELRKEELDTIAHNTTRARELCAQLDAELALKERQWKIDYARKERKSRSTGSNLEQSFAAHNDRYLEVHRIATRARKKAHKDYADNPEMFRLALMAIENWVAEQLGKVE
jgi:hypothetical protein